MARIEEHELRGVQLISVVALGWSLSIFVAISYALCVLFYALLPNAFANHAVLSVFLPSVSVLSWPGFLVGLLFSFVCGWYVALIFGPLYNFFVAREK